MSAADASDSGRFGRFEIVAAERRLHVDGLPVALGSRAYDLLAALVARRDRVVPKDELIEVVWPGLVVEENNLQVQISALRKVLGAQAIATVPGRGYRFTVSAAMPAAVAAAAATPSASMPTIAARASRPREPVGPSAGSAARARLLVADDNKVNRLLLCRSLALMGHEVESVENGRGALELLAQGRFDLLLLDLEMPELDGFGLLEHRADDPVLRELPVIVTSSLEGAAAVARCIELGADDYLHKPVNPVLLAARVASSLERKRLRDAEKQRVERLAPGAPGDLGSGGGQRVEATLLSARLHGIDPLGQPPDQTLELLADWTTLMVEAIEGQGGLVHRMSGDGLEAVFGAGPAASGDADAPLAAARAAREMQEMVALFNGERLAAGKRPVDLAVGLASGEIVAGYAGTARRAVHVCVGPPVQRAAALEAIAAERGMVVVLDAATHAAMAGRMSDERLDASPSSSATEAAYRLAAG